MSTNETADAMRCLAQQAVGLSVKAGMTLDYSELSLTAVDAYVGQLHAFLHSPENTWTDKMKWSFALTYGGYLGEVIRRSAGGEWVAGTLRADPKLLVDNVELSAAAKVLKRMNNGIEDHLGHYAESVLRGIIPAAAGKSGRVIVGYETLTAHERFQLLIEAMARKDEVECDRLEDSCPKMVYRCDDADFRDRMRRAYTIAVTVCLNMRDGITRMRMAEAMRVTAHDFAGVPAKVAQVALLYGRAYGHWEAGAVEQIDLPDSKALAKELAADEHLREQLHELRDAVGETVARVVGEIHAAVGRVHATEVLSMWEGFGRFCRGKMDMEPLTLVRAYGIQREDPAAAVLAIYPDERPDEAEVTRWAGQWCRGWERRFEQRK